MVRDRCKDGCVRQRRVLERYYQTDVTVLRKACRRFCRPCLQIGNVEVFLESMTIASACN